MQKQIENDGDEHDDPVDTQYIGNENIKMSLKNLKAELTRVRSDATHIVSGGEGIEETIEAKGKIISIGNCGVLNFPKNQRNYFKPLKWVKPKE